MELRDAVTHYLESVSHEIASDFDAVVQKGIHEIGVAPARYSLWKNTKARKYVVRRFPYLIFYLDYPDRIRIIALAHTARRPGYWKARIAG